MHTLVSMIRGINVAGSRPLKMDRLKALLEDLGLLRVRTYLQSGNAVFDSASPDAGLHSLAIERRILRDYGYEVAVATKTSKSMSAAAVANPFLRRPELDPAFLHATFLIGLGAARSLEGPGLPLARGEEAVLRGDVVYLYCPNGYGVTKMNNSFLERRLSARATTRNWRTVTALERMARGEPP